MLLSMFLTGASVYVVSPDKIALHYPLAESTQGCRSALAEEQSLCGYGKFSLERIPWAVGDGRK